MLEHGAIGGATPSPQRLMSSSMALVVVALVDRLSLLEAIADVASSLSWSAMFLATAAT
jgi:hypothetical protein